MSMLVIGITGPTGCGKTTLLQAVQQRGGYIVDCDALYYTLLASKEGAALRQELRTAFPDAFAADAGTRESFARAADQYLTNILKGAFPMTKQEREALLYQPKHGRDRLTKEDEAAMLTYCEDYKAFLDRSKTERECVVSAVELAEKAGFRELTAGMALKAGDKVYSVNRGSPSCWP